MFTRTLKPTHFIAMATLCVTNAMAQTSLTAVTVTDAWARATVSGQKATGAFMTLTAKDGAKLLGVSTPAAAVAEIHEMKMDKDVMKMAALPNGLDLPAGQAVTLKPGGYHVMLMDLKAPLAKDSMVALTLSLQDAKGVKSTQVLNVPVRQQAPMAQGMVHDHGEGQHTHGEHKH